MDPLPPDPYAALNVSRDASAAEIKTAYRKLALKFHPDKAKDKGEEFHRIQQAYELIGEDESRKKYEDSLRFAELKKNIFSRRGSSQNSKADVRTAAFNVRTSSYPGGGFQAHGPPRYEERRPPGTSTSAPRSPYAEEDKSDSYFPERSSWRKYDGADPSPRRTSAAKAPKTAPRSEEVRETLRKQEKFESTKSRNDKKKQRAQEMGRERKGKLFQSFAQSDDSDDAFLDSPSRRRRSSRQEETSRRENRRSEDEYHDQKYQEQSNTAKGYMNRAKTEAVSAEHTPPSPTAAASQRRSSLQQEIPLRTRSSSEQEPDLRRARRDGPVLVRKSSSKPKDKSSADASQPEKKLSKDPRSKTTDRPIQDPLYPAAERRPPTLTTSNSSPSTIKIPKTRSSDDQERPVPRFDRAATMPSQPPQQTSSRAVPRKTDTTPVVSSNLRHTETNDSGYSTGTSPNDTPQATYPTSMRYTYGTETVSVETGGEFQSVLREPNRQRRSPSPYYEPPSQRERPSSTRDREREREKPRDRERPMPPPSRSASYNQKTNPEPDRSSRRPSLTGRNSSGRVPSYQRSSTTPLPTPPLQTSGLSKDGLLFGEYRKAESPTDFREPNWGSSGPSMKRVYDDAKVSYGPRFGSDDISYSYRAPPGRRGSEDLRGAHAYMPEERGRRSGVATPG